MTKLLWTEPEPTPLQGFARRFATSLAWAFLALGTGLMAVGRIAVHDASKLMANPVLLLDLLRQPLVLGACAAIVAMLATKAAVDEWEEVMARWAEPAVDAGPTTVAHPSRARRVTVGSVGRALVFIGLAVGIFVFRPLAWGGSTSYAIVIGISMEPTMHTGDLAIVMRQDAYAVGDIVSYHPTAAPDGEIMHRVVGGDAATGYVTRGDNRADADPDRSTTAAIVGKVLVHVPYLGFAVNSLRNPYVLGTLVAVLVMGIAWDLVAKRSQGTRHRSRTASR